ncbi:MAG: serine/threonine protein kinase [Ktedonobacteraceae bacterium]
MQDLVGQQLGNYNLIQLLGRGGYADVYLGTHMRLDSQAAIKVLHTRLVNSEEIDNFQNEGRIIARLIHPHIIRILDFDVQQDIPFMVMDYAPNGTLRKRHPKGEQLALPVILPYVKQVADALQYAHDQHYIHRDVKPENMLLGRNEEVLLSDFGTALAAQATGYQQAVQEEVVGTVSYMAPEQLQGNTRPASDQYALAVVVYEWLSGSLPFHGGSTEVAIQHSMIPPPSLREKVPGLSPQVEQVIMRALSKDYHERYPGVQDFATALEQASYAGGSVYSDPTLAVPMMTPGAHEGDRLHLSSPQANPASHTAYPPVKPAPLVMDTVTSAAAHVSTPPPARPPLQNAVMPPVHQPYYQEQAQPRRRNFGWAILLLLVVLLLVVGGLAWYIIPHLGSGTTGSSTGGSTPAGQQGPVYPKVAGAYSGTLINATAGITTGMALTIQQNNSDITGSFTVNAPLVGSNPFTGHVNPGKHIWFTVKSYKGNAPLYFDGTIQPDGSLTGNYCSLGSNGQCSAQTGASGTWRVAHSPTSRVYQGQAQEIEPTSSQCSRKSCRRHDK